MILKFLLLVASDRVSAFDFILPNGIPNKGAVLTSLSEFWFSQTSSIVKNHLISTDVNDFPEETNLIAMFSWTSNVSEKNRTYSC